MASVSIETVIGLQTLLIDGDPTADTALVTDAGDQVRVVLNGATESFDKADFERIRFLGRSGDDFFANLTDIDSAAFGHNGNDELIGGNGHNWIQGGAGDDEITGGDRNDALRGRDGNDTINGGKRHDRIFGGNGADVILAGAGNDFIHGEEGFDTIFGGNGNDRITGGGGNDTIDAGSGNDSSNYNRAYSSYSVFGDSIFSVSDDTGADGTDRVSGVQTFGFLDGNRTAAQVPTASEQVVIRPIVLSNADGSNTAEFFGTSSQEAEIKFLIDEIYFQADVDIVWETARSWNNTFANIGDGGDRPRSDLDLIVDAGDAAGQGSSNARVIDMYFLEIAPGFGDLGENFANGLAFISASGVGIHIGDILPGSANGRKIAANVAAHEIGHNFGLEHVESAVNLMAENGSGTALTQSQVNTIRDSNLSQPV